MRNFQQVFTGVDVQPLLHQLTVQRELWNAAPIRSQYGQHKDTDDILLRYNKFDPAVDDPRDAVVSSIQCVNYPAFAALQAAILPVFGLMARVHGEHLGRVFISRLPPGASIPLHSDRDPATERDYPNRPVPAVYYERYQLTLYSRHDVVFRCGDEQIYMEPGTVWWFDNQLPHSVENRSPEERIAMTIDIRPYRPVAAW